jgi:hypothetical protein
MEGKVNILDYIFLEPFPWTWLVEDILALLLSLFVLAFIIRRSKHPVVLVLEAFAFVFLYASLYENAAIVMGLYTYGRSLVMIGFVPASVPLIEVCVLITGFWFLEKTSVPDWAKPPIIGLFGMLNFSLDPLAIRQVYTSAGVTREVELADRRGDVNILNIPVFNFPGWMLIMLYGAACLLVGRWWYRKSGYRARCGLYLPIHRHDRRPPADDQPALKAVFMAGACVPERGSCRMGIARLSPGGSNCAAGYLLARQDDDGFYQG